MKGLSADAPASLRRTRIMAATAVKDLVCDMICHLAVMRDQRDGSGDSAAIDERLHARTA